VIERYSDHAANERTYLAWVRTAIAVAAFGFLVEKFDLFLRAMSRTLGGRAPSEVGERVADITGLLIIALAGLMMVLATVRFRRTSTAIDSPEKRPAKGVRLDIALIGLLMLFGAALFGYMTYSVVDHLT
jgi:putative membrane protein